MSMTNDELRQAIEDAAKLVRSTAPDSPVYDDTVRHLRALLAEQQRRAGQALPVFTPVGPVLVQPAIVQPTWVPYSTGNPPWKPPFEVTCGTQ